MSGLGVITDVNTMALALTATTPAVNAGRNKVAISTPSHVWERGWEPCHVASHTRRERMRLPRKDSRVSNTYRGHRASHRARTRPFSHCQDQIGAWTRFGYTCATGGLGRGVVGPEHYRER